MSDPFTDFESTLGSTDPLDLKASNNDVFRGFDDPAAEFLAREQAELDKIENGQSNGFGDAFGEFSDTAKTVTSNGDLNGFDANGFDSNDPFGTTEPAVNGTHDSVPSNNTPTNNDTSLTDREWVVVNDGNKSPDTQPQDLYSAISKADKLTAEPEKIKVWREEQKLRLETKDAEEEQKKKEWKEAAKKELDDWYKNRNEQLAKTHANNKTAEAEYTMSSTPGQEWDRMTKLCDFNPKANKNVKDVSRMRSILLQLKQQPLAR